MATQTKARALISRRTRNLVREFLVQFSTLREISDFFAEGEIQADKGYDPNISGERRTLVEQYYKTLDFSDSEDASRALLTFASILALAQRTSTEGFLGLRNSFEEDGYLFIDGMLQRGSRTISEVTRRGIIDEINFNWSGRLDEVKFLERLYPLGSLPSTDPRYQSAKEDIIQHRIGNEDWDADWVFSDARFDLISCPDEPFLRFLCEALHPLVRSNPDEVAWLVLRFNEHLGHDGWEIAPCGEISGRPIFTGRKLHHGLKEAVEGAKAATENLNSAYISRQITRMEGALVDDPELAIGTAKEFVETICKTILDLHQVSVSKSDDMPKLVKETLKQLKLTPDDIPDSAKLSDTIKRLLMNLATITSGLAEIRNAYGSGHGKVASAKGLQSRHTRLAVRAATTLGVFLFETHQEQAQEGIE